MDLSLGKSMLAAAFGLTALATSASAQTRTNVLELQSLAARNRTNQAAEKRQAEDLARLLGLPIREILADDTVRELVAFRRGRPVYLKTDNANAAITTRANRVAPGGTAGLQLTGLGVVFGVWDGGAVRPDHQEFGGRVTVKDASNYANHGTHVGGTIAASGVFASAKGMSPKGTISSYDWVSDASEMAAAASSGLRLSNHSYGYLTGWSYQNSTWYWEGDVTVSTTEDAGFGHYESTAQEWDNIAYNAPNYLIVKSAGNDRGEGPAPGTGHYYWNPATGNYTYSTATRNKDGNATGYDTLPYYSVAKNILTVGAVDDVLNYTGASSVAMSSFSGWGPTDDGRIKPDIVGNGVSVTSSTSGSTSSYGSASGTSMSTPNVTGSLGLLVEHHRSLNSGADMLSATLKALTIHTADEAGSNPGPDYAFGWGLMNTERAAQVITTDKTQPESISENVLQQGATFTKPLQADGTQPLRVTIAWTDPAATPRTFALNDRTPRLVNDLDVRVVGPDGTTYLPWTLDPAVPNAPAAKGDNLVDNVEQIVIDVPNPGNYTLRVTHKGTALAPSGVQAFSVVMTGATEVTASLATLSLSPTSTAGGTTVNGTVTLESAATGNVVVSLSSNSTSATVPATVTVLSGQTSTTFPVATVGVDAVQSATIKATLNTKSASASLRIDPALASYLVFSRSSVAGGTALTGTVFLKGNAGPSGVTVALASSDLALTVPASVAVSAGANSASFPVGTTAVDADTPATVSAKTGAKAVTKAVTVLAATLKSLTLSPTSVTGGAGSKATIALTGPAGPSGLVVALSSSNPAASVPASVSVPAGASSATVTVGTTAVASDTSATVSATAGGKTASAVLGVKAPVLKSLTLGAATVASGGRVALAVSLTGPAPAGGIVVSLSSSHPALAKLPATTTVAQGATSKTVVFYAGTASAPTQVTLTGAQGGVSKSVVLTVNP